MPTDMERTKTQKRIKAKGVTRISKANKSRKEDIQRNAYGVILQMEENPESVGIIDEIQSLTGMTMTQLATCVYEMTPKTLASYRDAGKHLPSRSLEISIKLKQLYAKADELFLNKKDFNSWLREESYGLGGRVPLNLLNTSSGIDLVFEELTRIEFGATA